MGREATHNALRRQAAGIILTPKAAKKAPGEYLLDPLKPEAFGRGNLLNLVPTLARKRAVPTFRQLTNERRAA